MAPKHSPRILLIDDDPSFAEDIASSLRDLFHVLVALDAEAGLRYAGESRPDVILLDYELNDGIRGIDLLPEMTAGVGAPPVIMLTVETSPTVIVEVIKAGAFHYMSKPADFDALLTVIHQALAASCQSRRLEALETENDGARGKFVVEDPLSRALLAELELIAPTNYTALLLGETGSGKEMVARLIHRLSARREGPFVAINCAAVPGQLIESEFFGHEKGAFTDATQRQPGKFDLAQGGTIFLDEIGEAPPAVQVKLLRVLQERTYHRVGGTVELGTDARVIAATSRDLQQEVEAGRFREDLYYRLNLYPVRVPALRDRPGDIMPLAEKFLVEVGRSLKRNFSGFDTGVEEFLLKNTWPGNVRELRSKIVRAALRARGKVITLGDIWDHGAGVRGVSAKTYDEARSQLMNNFKQRYFSDCLSAARGNVTAAAELAGIPIPSFYRHLRDIGLDPGRFRAHDDQVLVDKAAG